MIRQARILITIVKYYYILINEYLLLHSLIFVQVGLDLFYGNK